MQNSMMLESIWNGEISASRGAMGQEVLPLLTLMLPVRTVSMSATSGLKRSCFVSEATQLLPDLQLGDVLAEELNVDVPFGAMVAFFKQPNWTDSHVQSNVSFDLGLLIGDSILELVSNQILPAGCKRDVLLNLVNSYCRLAEKQKLQCKGVNIQTFREGTLFALKDFLEAEFPNHSVSRDTVIHAKGYFSRGRAFFEQV